MPGAGPARAAGTRREYVPVGSTAAIPAADGPGPSYRSDLSWTPMPSPPTPLRQAEEGSSPHLSARALPLITLTHASSRKGCSWRYRRLAEMPKQGHVKLR